MIEESGRPELVWVSRGWPVHAFLSCDQGKQRSLSDYLSIQGEKQCNALASSLRYGWIWTLRKPVMRRRDRFGAIKGLDWLERNGSILKILREFSKYKEILVPCSMLVGLYYVTAKKDRDWADRMFRPLLTVTGDCDHGPKILRQKLIQNSRKVSHMRAPREQLMAWLVKLWNLGDAFDPRLRAPDYEESLSYD